jgi:Sigma-70 region 2
MAEDGWPPIDADLVEASLHEPQRFAALFDRHARTVQRYMASRVRPGEVDDVVSETFVVAFRTRARYDPASGRRPRDRPAPPSRPSRPGSPRHPSSRPGKASTSSLLRTPRQPASTCREAAAPRRRTPSRVPGS